LFASTLNAGDLDGLAGLYEPQAALSPQPGTVVTGARAIREALSGFVAAKVHITLDTKILAHANDVALMTSKWDLSATGPDGKPMKLSGQSTEVARRQPDGTWRFVIDLPWGS
jgi:uncharacterized protein (TIGR02246 family)